MLTHACQEGKGVKLQGEGSKFCLMTLIVSENPGAVGVDSGLRVFQQAICLLWFSPHTPTFIRYIGDRCVCVGVSFKII